MKAVRPKYARCLKLVLKPESSIFVIVKAISYSNFTQIFAWKSNISLIWKFRILLINIINMSMDISLDVCLRVIPHNYIDEPCWRTPRALKPKLPEKFTSHVPYNYLNVYWTQFRTVRKLLLCVCLCVDMGAIIESVYCPEVTAGTYLSTCNVVKLIKW